MRPQEEEELVINATLWQLPPDGGVSCDDPGAPDVLNSHMAQTTSGTDECQSFLCSLSPRDSDMVLPNTDGSHRAARGRAESWPGCATKLEAPLLHSGSEGDLKSQNPSRPFLSLMLPEWVHEKAAEDEAAGAFRCRSLVPFNTSSPTNSSVGSPVSSCACSPQVPSKAELHTVSVRRSGVCWADLAEESEEETLTGSPSDSFRAESPTDSSTSSLASSRASSPRASSKLELHAPRVRRSGVCWADLPDSDEETLDATCGFGSAESQAEVAALLTLRRPWSLSRGDWPCLEGEALRAALVH